MNLYELSGAYRAMEEEIEQWAEKHDGDITDYPWADKFTAIEEGRSQKLLNYGVWYKNLMANAAELKAQAVPFEEEIKSLTHRAKVFENKAKRVKKILQEFAIQGETIEDSRCKLAWRKNTALHIPEEVTVELFEEQHPELVEDVIKTEKSFRKNELKKEVKDAGYLEVTIPASELMEVKEHTEIITIPAHKNIQIK